MSKSLIINSIPLLSPLSGIGRYTFEISKRLNYQNVQAELTYFYGFPSKQPREPLLIYNKISTFHRLTLLKKAAKRILTAAAKLNPNKYDLYWEPNNLTEDFIRSRKTILTLHDISVIRHPQWHPKTRVELFKNRLNTSLNRADFIITDSAFSRTEILETLAVDEDRVRTIYLGYDKDLFFYEENLQDSQLIKARFTNGHDYILFSGSLEPRKNLLSLIKAYSALPADFKENFKLLLVGAEGWNNREILNEIHLNRKSVVHAGYVSYDELAQLYRHASLFAYPSYYEGFGLPPLEAMACGCPVLTSHRASLPEVCGDAAYYVNPDNIDEIREGILKIISNTTLSQQMRLKGLAQCLNFDWDTTASKHMDCMKELL